MSIRHCISHVTILVWVTIISHLTSYLGPALTLQATLQSGLNF